MVHQAVGAGDRGVDGWAFVGGFGFGVAGPGFLASALRIALATIGDADILVDCGFNQTVTSVRMRLFNATKSEQRYGLIEIRT